MRGSPPLAASIFIAVTFFSAAPLFAQSSTPSTSPAPSAASTEATPIPSVTAIATPMPTPEAPTTPITFPGERAPGVPVDASPAVPAISFVPVVSGWITPRYDSNDGAGPARANSNSFVVQFARLQFDGHVHPLIAYRLSLDAAGALLGGAGGATGVAPFVREAYVSYDHGPMLQVMAGRMRKPVGYETRVVERDRVPMDRAAATIFIDNGQNYDVGLAAGGSVELGPAQVTYIGGVFNGDSNGATSDSDSDKDFLFRVGIGSTDGTGIHGGASLMSGRGSADAGTDDPFVVGPSFPQTYAYTRGAFDVEASFGPFFAVSEGVYGNTTLYDGTITPVGARAPTTTSSAVYVLAGYHVGETVTPWARYSYFERSSGKGIRNFDPNDWNNTSTIGVNYQLIKKVTLIRVQYDVTSGMILGATGTGAAGGFSVSSRKISGTASASIQVSY